VGLHLECMRSGVTLFELLVALAIGSVTLSLTLPRARRGEDRLAVRSAQTALAHAVRTARAAAERSGSAEVVVQLDSATVRLVRPGRSELRLSLGTDFGVSIRSGTRGTGEARFRFDRLGVGRFASRSLTVRRGQATRQVVISSYGRVSTP